MATTFPVRPGARGDDETEPLVREVLVNNDREPDEDARDLHRGESRSLRKGD
jgi:hypothetical protein